MKNKYADFDDFFTKRYKLSFSKKDIETYQQWFYPQAKIVKEFTGAISGKTRTLEMGSSFGGFYDMLSAMQQKNYVGLELDAKICQFANKFHRTDKFKNIAIEDYNPKERFDFIYAFEVLEHIIDPISVIKKMSRLLKNNGKFVGTSPYPYKWNVLTEETHQFVLHPTNWKRLFLQNGFSKVTTKPLTFFPYLWRINKKLNPRIPININIPHMISTTLIVAEK